MAHCHQSLHRPSLRLGSTQCGQAAGAEGTAVTPTESALPDNIDDEDDSDDVDDDITDDVRAAMQQADVEGRRWEQSVTK